MNHIHIFVYVTGSKLFDDIKHLDSMRKDKTTGKQRKVETVKKSAKSKFPVPKFRNRIDSRAV